MNPPNPSDSGRAAVGTNAITSGSDDFPWWLKFIAIMFTGAIFAVLPAQNATGNWVKIVQRVPVRIRLDDSRDLDKLRAGMRVVVDIDTRHTRSLADLWHGVTGLFGG